MRDLLKKNEEMGLRKKNFNELVDLRGNIRVQSQGGESKTDEENGDQKKESQSVQKRVTGGH